MYAENCVHFVAFLEILKKSLSITYIYGGHYTCVKESGNLQTHIPVQKYTKRKLTCLEMSAKRRT
jgi:tRNA U34 2-thiouridine synthase MnmA/TrmU